MDGNTANLQANILFWIIIALFAWQGYQRGIWSELTKLAFIIAGFLVGTPEYLGRMLVKAINGFHRAFLFLFHGGLKAIVTGNFNAKTLSRIFAEIDNIPRLISKDNFELALFLVMLFLIIIGYLVSKLFKKDKKPGLGMVIGAINGYLLSMIFLPLLPDKAPFAFNDMSPAGVVKQIAALIKYLLQNILDLFIKIFDSMFDIFGAWTIPILILLIIFITLSSLTRSKKKGGGRSICCGGSNGGGGGGN